VLPRAGGHIKSGRQPRSGEFNKALLNQKASLFLVMIRYLNVVSIFISSPSFLSGLIQISKLRNLLVDRNPELFSASNRRYLCVLDAQSRLVYACEPGHFRWLVSH
jgi:hypothetical protein